MGQKTNSNIFRLGLKNNNWNSKYFGKNKEESSLYTYQNVQIQSYLKQFFNKNGLVLQNTKLHFNGTNLFIFISYYTTKKSFFLINKSTPNQFIKFKSKTRKTSKSPGIDNDNLKLSNFLNYNKQTNNDRKRFDRDFKIKNKRLKIMKNYKNFLSNETYHTKELIKKNNFLEQLLEGLSLFTNKKYHIFLTFQNLNKGLSVKLSEEEQNFLKKKILFFKRYSKNKFFKESLNIILIMTKTKNSAKLFSHFLANQISGLKRHNHFLIFLKRVLTLFIYTKFSKIEGIKIVISGRFNGAPRSKSRLMLIGNIPIQTIGKDIDYYQTISFTKNGTFGIKVWISQN
jgi:ribosomal protein S3